MKKILFFLIISFSFFGWADNSQAANWFVSRSGNNSNGSNWTNAWNEMGTINWSSISPGDTIWLAGGTYATPLDVGANGTSNNRIYIKRVLSSDSAAVSAQGWNNSFDSQVVINVDKGIQFSSAGSYVTVDGQVDSGIRSILRENSWDSSAVSVETNVQNIVVQYVDMQGPQSGSTYHTFTQDCKSLRFYSASNPATNATFRYNRIHGCVDQIMINGLNGATFEYNKLYDNLVANDAQFHAGFIAGRVCSGTIIYRYNEHYNGIGEGIMLGATAGDQACPWEIYGNSWHGNGMEGIWRAVELQITVPVKFNNNTVVDMWAGIVTSQGGSFASGSEIMNNTFTNVGNPIGGAGGNVTVSGNTINGSGGGGGGPTPTPTPNPTPTPTPNPTPTPTPTPPRTYTVTDFTNLVSNWLRANLSSSPISDANLDRKVNSRDLGIMMSNWQ